MNQANPKGQLTGRQVFLWFACFFAVVIVTNVVFVRLAVQSFPGEEVEKSYYQGLHYNDVLETKERQASQGWRMQLIGVPEGIGDQAVVIRLLDRSSTPVVFAEVNGEIVRPMTESGRQRLTFDGLGDGRYRAMLAGLDRGAWDLTLEAAEEDSDEPAFSAQTRILIE
ncbi:MAG: FixH family protein [Pseudomonadota bacterium]